MGVGKKSLFLGIIFILMVYQNCAPMHSSSESSSLENLESFDYESLWVKTIQPKCASCHNSSSPAGGIDLSSHSAIISSGSVRPGNKSSSTFYLEVEAGTMPPGAPLSQQEINDIGIWIDNGATSTSGSGGGYIGPIVDAGPDQSSQLPLTAVNLPGYADSRDENLVRIQWTQISGPNTANLQGEFSFTLSVSNLVVGVYVFQLEAEDTEGATSADSVQLTITGMPNVAPTISAGADQTITLPTSSASLTGTASDSDGTIASVAWTQVNGPATVSFTSANQLSTAVNGLTAAGSYDLQLAATDDEGASASDVVRIVVNSANNISPTANAGADVTIQLPTNMATLNGMGTDPDGTIASYAWGQISGPSTATLAGANTANLTASNLIAGDYEFELTVADDGGATSSDRAKIIVQVQTPTFTEINTTILQPKCVNCHGAVNPKGNYAVDNYINTIKGVAPGNPNASALYLRSADGSMPPGNPLTSAEYEKIRLWILDGAQNN